MWDWFINFLTFILTELTDFCGDWGLAIILMTFVIRLLLTPLSVKQIKSTTRMSLMQPKIQEIQERYANDQARQAQEMQKIYSESNANPIGGCLPMLIQMPVFFALFTVLKNLPADACFYNILPQLSVSANDRIAAVGIAAGLPYVITDILFGILTLIPMLLNQTGTADQRKQTMMMGGFMAILMVWVGWNLPVGVNVYYVTSAAWGVFQQLFITTRIRNKLLAEEEERRANAPIQVDVVRKEKKQRPHKKA